MQSIYEGFLFFGALSVCLEVAGQGRAWFEFATRKGVQG